MPETFQMVSTSPPQLDAASAAAANANPNARFMCKPLSPGGIRPARMVARDPSTALEPAQDEEHADDGSTIITERDLLKIVITALDLRTGTLQTVQ